MPTVFWSSFLAAPVIGLRAAYLVLPRRWSDPSAWLFISILFTAIRFAIQAWLYLVDKDLAALSSFYSLTMPLAALINILACVGIFWSLAEKYPNFRAVGTGLVIGLALLSFLATWAMPGVGDLPFGAHPLWLSVSLFFYRHGMTVAGFTMLSSRFLLTRMRRTIPVSDWSVRAADLFSGYAIAAAVIGAFTMATGTQYPYLIATLPIANFLWYAAGCIFWLAKAERDTDSLPAPAPRLSRPKNDGLEALRLLESSIRRQLY